MLRSFKFKKRTGNASKKIPSSFLKHGTSATKREFLSSVVRTFTVASPGLSFAILLNAWPSLNFHLFLLLHLYYSKGMHVWLTGHKLGARFNLTSDRGILYSLMRSPHFTPALPFVKESSGGKPVTCTPQRAICVTENSTRLASTAVEESIMWIQDLPQCQRAGWVLWISQVICAAPHWPYRAQLEASLAIYYFIFNKFFYDPSPVVVVVVVVSHL